MAASACSFSTVRAEHAGSGVRWGGGRRFHIHGASGRAVGEDALAGGIAVVLVGGQGLQEEALQTGGGGGALEVARHHPPHRHL